MAEAGHEVGEPIGLGAGRLPCMSTRRTNAEHIAPPNDTDAELTGTPPAGLYQGRHLALTRCGWTLEALAASAYSADSYRDDLPYWETTPGRPILMVPYTPRRQRHALAHARRGSIRGDPVLRLLRDAFDALYAEGMRPA